MTTGLFFALKSLTSSGLGAGMGSPNPTAAVMTLSVRLLSTKPLSSAANATPTIACNCFTSSRTRHTARLGTTWGQETRKFKDATVRCGLGSHNTGPLTQVRFLADSKTVEEKVEKFRQGSFEDIPDPSELPHFKSKLNQGQKASATSTGQQKTVVDKDGSLESLSVPDPRRPEEGYSLPHPIWTEDQLQDVHITHKAPQNFVDRVAYGAVRLFRGGFDVFSGFLFGQRTEGKWLNRIVFLETVAGVPGMVAAMMRHMRSLRRLQRDQGWIHTLLEEAENERMHLLTAMQLKQPSLFFRLMVIGAQGVFVTMFGACYIVSPRFCHRFVGYLEEEAVKTYTKCLQDIKDGPMQHWNTQPAPAIAVRYWKLATDATMRDVILAIRADEAHHRLVNHSLASLKKDEFNPYKPGE